MKRITRRTALLAGVALMILPAMALAACGVDGDDADTPGTTPAAESPTEAPGAGGETQQITIVARNTSFQSGGTASAGSPVELTLDNRDEDIGHNLVVRSPNDRTLAQTDIIAGPDTATITCHARRARRLHAPVLRTPRGDDDDAHRQLGGCARTSAEGRRRDCAAGPMPLSRASG